MTQEDLPVVLFVGLMALMVGAFLYQVLKHGGFKAAMFGAAIDHTVGEVASSRSRLLRVGLRVHKLKGGRKRAVGVELVAKSFASYQMMPVALSVTEAKQLIALLEEATMGQDAT